MLSEDAETTDPKQAHPLKDPENLPVVLVSNPKFRQGDFAPGIALWDEPAFHPNPPDLAGEIAAHQRMLRGFARSYRDHEVVEAPQLLSVTGATGTQAVWKYLHELDDGQEWRLKIRSLLFFRTTRVHTFYLIDEDTSPKVPLATEQRFLQSLTYR